MINIEIALKSFDGEIRLSWLNGWSDTFEFVQRRRQFDSRDLGNDNLMTWRFTCFDSNGPVGGFIVHK